VERSKRRGIERLLSRVGIYPFRCRACYRRFWRRLLAPPPGSL